MDTTPKIISRIRKLLALSQSPNEHEATLAAERAQELLAKYHLSIGEIKEENQEREGIEDQIVERLKKRRIVWKDNLINGISSVYYCRYYSSWETKGTQQIRIFRMIGRPSNIAVAQEVYTYLVVTIERLAEEALEQAKIDFVLDYSFSPKSYSDSWKKGCVARIVERLKENKRQMEKKGIENIPSTALALIRLDEVEQQAIEQHIESKKLKLRSISNTGAYNRQGYNQGYQAGNNINLSPQVGPGKANKTLR